jgi:predicted ferric reductase
VGPDERLPRRTGTGRRRRRIVLVVFWAGLFALLTPWWLTAQPGDINSAADALTETGRLTGLIAGYVLLIQILSMSRVGWLEQRVGAAELMAWHRDLGGYLVVIVLTHLTTITLGYAGQEGVGIWRETTGLWHNAQDMISAYLATGILVAIGLLCIRAIRSRLNYEVWYILHLSAYVVLLLSYGHQFADGRDLLASRAGRWSWIALYILVLWSVFWGRIVAPARLNWRHRLRVAQVVPEGNDMFSLYVTGRRLDEVPARAGQFFRWRFLSRGMWHQAHPFSLSAAPNHAWLRLTIKAVGDFTGQLQFIEPGTRVIIEGPSGVFTADRRTRPRAMLIAGGSGIAPIRALLEDMPRGAVVLYRARSVEELIFREELDWLASARDADVWYVIGSRDDPAPRRALSPRGLRELVPDITRRDVYLCGPVGLIEAARASLAKLRVPKKQIHLDPFEF